LIFGHTTLTILRHAEISFSTMDKRQLGQKMLAAAQEGKVVTHYFIVTDVVIVVIKY